LNPSELQTLKEQVDSIRWFHTFDFGNGLKTPGYDNSARKLKRLHLPESLAGKTVLDIGAWDGYFAFECERRGASRVVAADSQAWRDGGKRGFELARSILHSRVEDRDMDIMDPNFALLGRFDVVLFLGVLYHMRHPMLALEHLSSVTAELAIVETVVDLLGVRRPAMAIYPDSELANDDSNWCGPNVRALTGMLKAVGFRDIKVVSGARPLPFRLARSAWYAYHRGYSFWEFAQTDRVVVQARK
jgi:tRNA (mo5U34)-methyltransferase